MRLLGAVLLAALPLAFASPAQHPFLATKNGAGEGGAFTASLQGLKLADALTVEKRATMFYSYARDYSKISSRLSSNLLKSTLVVPTDEVILALARKPHQGRPQVKADTVDEKEASHYLEEWVERHVIPELVDSEQSKEYDSMLSGQKVSFEKDDNGAWTVKPGPMHIVDIVEASNGLIILVDGTLPVN